MRKWNDDPYTKKARNENYEARSIYKLQEIEKRERVFDKVKTVIDLGASPGSWTQFCLEKLPANGKIYSIDLKPINVEDPRIEFVQESIYDWNPPGIVADLILSDMAPNTSGIADRDVPLSIDLCEQALSVALRMGHAQSKFVTKIFMGSGFEDFQKTMRQHFKTVKLYKPESTRKQSREIYFIGKELKK